MVIKHRTPGPRSTRPLVLALLALACAGPAAAIEYASSVWASGLNSPRGLNFGIDGALWVTEAGVAGGGGPSTVVRGETLVYNDSGSVTRIYGGQQARVITGLPTLYSAGSGQMGAGPNDIVFDAAGRAAILIGLGVNPAVRSTDLAPVGYRLGRIVTLGGAVDVAGHETDFNPDGGDLNSNPWNMALTAGGTLVTDAGANALLRVGADGSVSTLATFASRALGGPRPTESVPTGLAIGADGAAYVGELTGFPFAPGSARIHRVEADGSQSVFASGFTMITDIAFGNHGKLYVLEYDANGLLAPGSGGQLWQVNRNGSKSVIWSDGLVQPTGLAIGDDGAFYISNMGNGAGLGEVLRISAVPEAGTVSMLLAGLGMVWMVARRRQPA